MKRCLLLPLVVLPLFAADAPPAAPDLLDGLVRDSPFVTPAGGRTANADAGPFELRGVVFEGGAYSFSIYDPATKESAWVKLKENGFPFVARSFDRERDTLLIDYQGRSLALALQSTKTMASAQTAPAQSPAPLPTQPGATSQNGARSTTPATGAINPNQPMPNSPSGGIPPMPSTMTPAEAQRLQNLADEIRRRRNVGSPPVPPPQPKN